MVTEVVHGALQFIFIFLLALSSTTLFHFVEFEVVGAVGALNYLYSIMKVDFPYNLDMKLVKQNCYDPICLGFFLFFCQNILMDLALG